MIIGMHCLFVGFHTFLLHFFWLGLLVTIINGWLLTDWRELLTMCTSKVTESISFVIAVGCFVDILTDFSFQKTIMRLEEFCYGYILCTIVSLRPNSMCCWSLFILVVVFVFEFSSKDDTPPPPVDCRCSILVPPSYSIQFNSICCSLFLFIDYFLLLFF